MKKNDYIKIAALSVCGYIIGLVLRYCLPSNDEDNSIRITWHNGIYQGDTLRGEPHGFGEYIFNDNKYSGDWEYGELAEGQVITPSFTYYGPLENLTMTGYAHGVYYDSCQYYGEYVDGKKEGHGLLIRPDRKIMFGIFADDKYCPTEKLSYAYGDKVYGVDVSHHQGVIDWESMELFADEKGVVASKVTKKTGFVQPVLFAIIKSTEGKNRRDERFEYNFTQAKKCGIIRGAYHFLTSESSGEEQANYYIENTPMEKGDFPPILDIENFWNLSEKDFSQIINNAIDWLRIVEQHYKVQPVIYTNKHIYEKYIVCNPYLSKHKLWIANLSSEKSNIKNCIMWQFSHTATLNAIPDSKKSVDLNIFEGNYSDLKRYVEKYGIQ